MKGSFHFRDAGSNNRQDDCKHAQPSTSTLLRACTTKQKRLHASASIQTVAVYLYPNYAQVVHAGQANGLRRTLRTPVQTITQWCREDWGSSRCMKGCSALHSTTEFAVC